MGEPTELGTRTKEWRIGKKLTQVAFAHGARCKEQDVQAIENGRYVCPSAQRKIRSFMNSVSEERLAQLRNFKKAPVGKWRGAFRSRYAPDHTSPVGVDEFDHVAENILRL